MGRCRRFQSFQSGSGVRPSHLDFLWSSTRSLECGSNVLADLRSEKRRGRWRNSFLTTARTISVQKFKVRWFNPTLKPVPDVPVVQSLRSVQDAYRRRAVPIVPSLCSVPKVPMVPVRRISFNTFKPFNRCATFKTLVNGNEATGNRKKQIVPKVPIVPDG